MAKLFLGGGRAAYGTEVTPRQFAYVAVPVSPARARAKGMPFASCRCPHAASQSDRLSTGFCLRPPSPVRDPPGGTPQNRTV